ncbi:hypothetical protein [Halosolutus gelatinilyticus]|uniref:hypothetical protein n=1 Tax=Halosolutus gelatinilyticus TaxID=2931975 RepID=UPI001FF4619D|nr:hypothetical protein [Halosolutus gelatinilyticus]
MDSRYRILVLALLGVVFVLNPVYLYPDAGGGGERTYHVDRVENEAMADGAIALSERVVNCPGVRLCAAEERVLEDGAVEYDGHVQSFDERSERYEDPGWYPVVRIEGTPYLPEHEYEENGTVLTLTELSSAEAVERAAVPAADLPPEVREAVETGSITVYGDQIEAFERNEIVEHDGEYYVVTRFSRRSHSTKGVAIALLGPTLYALGIGLLFYSGREFGRRAD